MVCELKTFYCNVNRQSNEHNARFSLVHFQEIEINRLRSVTDGAHYTEHMNLNQF